MHEFLVGFMVLIGSVFCLLAAIGVLRFPDVYCRMHAASKAGLLGSGVLLLAIGVHALDVPVASRAVAGFVFLVLTAPLSAHLLARVALLSGYSPHPSTVCDEYATAREKIEKKEITVISTGKTAKKKPQKPAKSPA